MHYTAIILAGGKSSRMGRDKGLLIWQDKSVVEHAIQLTKQFCQETIIITKDKNYLHFGVPVFPDCIPDKGPAGGIYTGLLHSNSAYNLVIACDMPLITIELLQFLQIQNSINDDALVPVYQGNPQPLCAIYAKKCLKKLENFLRKDMLKMNEILKLLNTKYVTVPENLVHSKYQLFYNVNTPEEFEFLRATLAE